MVQSIVHIAEYICVPYLKSILDGSEYSAHMQIHMCSLNLKSILDGSEYSEHIAEYICVSKLKEHSRWFRV